jgi:diaminopimelate epimerase
MARAFARARTSTEWNLSGIDTLAPGRKFLAVPDTGDIFCKYGSGFRRYRVQVSALENGNTYRGFNVDVGNPHAVVFVDDLSQVGDLKRCADCYAGGCIVLMG